MFPLRQCARQATSLRSVARVRARARARVRVRACALVVVGVAQWGTEGGDVVDRTSGSLKGADVVDRNQPPFPHPRH